MAAQPPQFSMGKSLPGFGPIGPWVVTLDEVADPNDLELGCEINGETVQLCRTSQLIFSVAALIANLSASLPLLPGDVIFTGTPSGVGLGRTPPRWLADGDILTSHIEGHRRDAAPLRRRPAAHRLALLPRKVADDGPAPTHLHHHGRAERRGDRRLLRGVRPRPRRATAGSPPVTAAASCASCPPPTRRLVDLHVGVDDPDDLARAAGNLQRLGIASSAAPAGSARWKRRPAPALTWRSPPA